MENAGKENNSGASPIITVQSSIGYTLGNNLEDLTLTGSENINGAGNELKNSLTGNDGNNTLSGGDGADWLYGGFGDDYIVGGYGNDIMSGGAVANYLDAGEGALCADLFERSKRVAANDEEGRIAA